MSSQNNARSKSASKEKAKRTDGVMNGDATAGASEKLENIKQGAKEVVTNDWDYKLALTVITVLAFITRFYGITHPNQVVFDEVHFGKVKFLSLVTRGLDLLLC
jgi:dolichyl-phosphate-mannose-protein mannosyltransferase